MDEWNSPKLTLFETFVNWDIDVMGNGLLTVLFCLFCFAILGLLPSILTFGRHVSLVEEGKEGDFYKGC